MKILSLLLVTASSCAAQLLAPQLVSITRKSPAVMASGQTLTVDFVTAPGTTKTIDNVQIAYVTPGGQFAYVQKHGETSGTISAAQADIWRTGNYTVGFIIVRDTAGFSAQYFPSGSVSYPFGGGGPRTSSINFAALSFSVGTTPPTVRPTFSTQPTNQTAMVGATATFTAVAIGTPSPTYQWYAGNSTIAGATNATLTLSNLTSASAGNYSVVAANSAGSTASTVTLTVTLPDLSTRLINISTLANGGFTSGFVIAGTSSKTILIRAVGPTLTALGVPDAATQTTLTLYSGSTVRGTNSSWSAAANVAQISSAFTETGAFVLPSGSADAAILTSLAPGNYTAQAAGNGTVLLEVYEVP